jgi:uncharacterized repeat protein (TIGR01451 family)
VLQGGTVAYTITVHNAGPSDAANASVSDALPGGATFVATGSSPECAPGAPGTVTCAVGTLLFDETVTRTIVLQHNTVGPNIDTATVTSSTPDPNTTNNTDDAVVEVDPAADLSIDKTAPATVVAGGEMDYTLAVTNNGPSDATGVEIVDTLPPGTSFVSGAGCTAAAQAVTCAVGALANGATQNVTIRVSVPPALGDQTLTNSATVSGDQGDPDPSNNTDTAQTNVGPAVDMKIVKTSAGAVGGGIVTWTLAVSNGGPSTATDVQVADPLPAGVVFDGATPGQGTCALDAGVVRCALGTLAAGGATQIVLTAQVPEALEGTELVNTATVTATEPEVNPPDNTSTARTPVTDSGVADLRVTKTASVERIELGKPYDYVIRVSNVGTTTATGVVVTDALAAPLDLVSSSASQGTCTGTRTVRCEVGTIAPGAEATVTLRVVPTRAGDIENLATADALEGEATPGDSGGVAGVDVTLPRATLRLAKSAGKRTVRAGKKITFTMRLRVGGAAAQDVALCDRLPSGLSLVKAKGARVRRGQVCWTWDFLPANARRTVRIVTRVAAGTTARRLTNRADVVADGSRRRRAAAGIRVQPGPLRGGGVTG